MTREERCLLFIERGFTYNPETGIFYNRYKKEIKGTSDKGYVHLVTTINKKSIGLKGHHLAWYLVYGNCNIEQIDHINGIRNDNRIINLRNVTNQQNQFNKINSNGYYWNKQSKKWHSQIAINKNKIYLGYYNTEEEARNAYLQAKEKYHII